MQAAAIAIGSGSITTACKHRNRTRVSLSFGQFNKTVLLEGNSLTPKSRLYCLKSPLRIGNFGVEMARVRSGVDTIFRPKGYSLLARTRAAAGDIEDVPSDKLVPKSSGTVLPFVGVACLGAILFGYHLGVVNGALEYFDKDLGIAENAALLGQSSMISAASCF